MLFELGILNSPIYLATLIILHFSQYRKIKTDNCGRTGVGNRKSVIKETAIPVVETFIINPLECNYAPFGVNTFKGGHDYDQVSRDSQA